MKTIDTWRACRRLHVTWEAPSCLVFASNDKGSACEALDRTMRLVAMRPEVAPNDVASLVRMLDRFADVPEGTPTLYDLRLLDFAQIEAETVRHWVYLLSKASLLRKTRAAFVVSDELGFGMSRMLQQLAEARGITVQSGIDVTYSLAEAIFALRRRAQHGQRMDPRMA